MIINITNEIDLIGLENVARILRMSPNRLRSKVNNPRSFTLYELAVLKENAVITDKMVLLMLDNLKREE
jgi:hypothetical protein